MRTTALAVATAFLTFVTSAQAADQVDVAPTYNWSGIYTGLQAGGAWTRADDGVDVLRMNGGTFGAFAGANWQSGNLVFGVEGDVNYANLSGSIFAIDASAKLEGSLRARLGYAFDRTMIYGAAGLAVARVHVEAIGLLDKKETFTGWTVGGGAEYAFTDNWIARADYRYSDYGNSHFGIGGDGIDFTGHAVRLGVAYKF